jgi:hypothetical protein
VYHYCAVRSCHLPETWNVTVAGATAWLVTHRSCCQSQRLTTGPVALTQWLTNSSLRFLLVPGVPNGWAGGSHPVTPRIFNLVTAVFFSTLLWSRFLSHPSSCYTLLWPRRVFIAIRVFAKYFLSTYLGKTIRRPPRRRRTCPQWCPGPPSCGQQRTINRRRSIFGHPACGLRPSNLILVNRGAACGPADCFIDCLSTYF